MRITMKRGHKKRRNWRTYKLTSAQGEDTVRIWWMPDVCVFSHIAIIFNCLVHKWEGTECFDTICETLKDWERIIWLNVNFFFPVTECE